MARTTATEGHRLRQCPSSLSAEAFEGVCAASRLCPIVPLDLRGCRDIILTWSRHWFWGYERKERTGGVAGSRFPGEVRVVQECSGLVMEGGMDFCAWWLPVAGDSPSLN